MTQNKEAEQKSQDKIGTFLITTRGIASNFSCLINTRKIEKDAYG